MVNDRVIFVLALCLCTNCKLALCYQAAWKITVCYGAICKIVVSYHAIYKTVLSYFTFSNIFTTYLLSLQCFMDQVNVTCDKKRALEKQWNGTLPVILKEKLTDSCHFYIPYLSAEANFKFWGLVTTNIYNKKHKKITSPSKKP